MSGCDVCGKPLNERNKSGLCRVHNAKRMTDGLVRVRHACGKCGAEQRRKSKTGLCQPCFNADRPADFTERNTAGLRAKLLYDPVYREKLVNRLRMMTRSPEGRERSSRTARAMQLHKIGHKTAATPEAMEKRKRSISETKLAHVPRDYRDLYRALRKKTGVTAADALAMVKDQQARDLAKFREEIGR